MKLYHFALFFMVAAIGFFVTAQTRLVTKMQEEGTKQMEYDCLVAAVNAAADVAFAGEKAVVTGAGLAQAEEVFFQTLAFLHEGTTDMAAWKAWRQRIPCLVVFEERGCYLYCFVPETGYTWSELLPCQDGELPERFFATAETVLSQYHNLHYASSKRYRLEAAEKGVWEQGITPPCVFAVYAAQTLELGGQEYGTYLYAASGLERTAYFVTEDNYCHLPFCEFCKTGRIVARYASQRESAEDGAIPCESCFK